MLRAPFLKVSRTPRIAVVGSANVDLTTLVHNFPKPGETVFGKGFHLGFGGKGANQAVAARRCGADVQMVARVGDDLFGPATIEHLEAEGIDTAHVEAIANTSSGVAPILVDETGQNSILVVKGANDLLTSADVDRAAEALSQADCIVLQLEIPLETVYHTIELARSRGIRCILNPAPGQPSTWRASHPSTIWSRTRARQKRSVAWPCTTPKTQPRVQQRFSIGVFSGS